LFLPAPPLTTYVPTTCPFCSAVRLSPSCMGRRRDRTSFRRSFLGISPPRPQPPPPNTPLEPSTQRSPGTRREGADTTRLRHQSPFVFPPPEHSTPKCSPFAQPPGFPCRTVIVVSVDNHQHPSHVLIRLYPSPSLAALRSPPPCGDT